jgi:hypothetical protein
MRIHRLGRLLAGTALLAALPAIPAPALRAPSWLPVVDVAKGGGIKGPWRQNDSHYDYVDDGTAVFLPGGALAVAWVDQRRKEVLLRVRDANGKPQGEPVDVSRSPATFSWMPRLASGGEGALHVLWQEIIFSGGSHGGDILFARSLDGGRSFSKPLNLSASRGGDGKGRLNRAIWSNGSLDIAAGPGKAVHAAWTEYDGALWLASSRDGGSTFSPPVRVAGSERRPARAPSLAIDGQGRVHLAWTVGEDPEAAIHVARVDQGAGPGEPVRIGSSGARADAPRLAFDHAGALHLVFAEHPRGGAAPAIRHARADRSTLRFGAPRLLSAAGQPASFPHLAVDGQGNVHVAWEAGSEAPRGLVHAALGRSAPALVPHSADRAGGHNGSQQGLLGKKLAAGPDGRIAIVNSSLAPGRGSRVWLVEGRLAP